MPKRKNTVPVIFSTHPLHPQATARLEGHGDLVIASAIDAGDARREGAETPTSSSCAPFCRRSCSSAPKGCGRRSATAPAST